MTLPRFAHLASGFDTVECAYYLRPSDDCGLDFLALAAHKEALQSAKISQTPLSLGNARFIFKAHGSQSGYPFIIENNHMRIQFGEFNSPNFFVTYTSFGLWHLGLAKLHSEFLAWCASLGLLPHRPETVSRADYAFDYHLPVVDFDEENFVSRAEKDNKHRKNGIAQTFSFGKNELRLRVYNKSDEITETSGKTWFYPIWGQEENVWRIEWQVRKSILRNLAIHSIGDLQDQDGDLCLHLMEHTSLRVKTQDSNRSRWPLHPLWEDIAGRIGDMNRTGILRSFDAAGDLDANLTRIAISVHGYLKRYAAIERYLSGKPETSFNGTIGKLRQRIAQIHDPIAWDADVEKRLHELEVEYGQPTLQ